MIVAAPFEAPRFSDGPLYPVAFFLRSKRVVSASETSNAEFGPHPAEIVRPHGITVVAMATGLILKKFEPVDKLLAALLCPGGLARADVAQHTDRLIEGFPVVLVQRGMHDLGLQVMRELVRRARRPRLA